MREKREKTSRGGRGGAEGKRTEDKEQIAMSNKQS